MKKIEINNCSRFNKCPFCESLMIDKIGNIKTSDSVLFSSTEISLMHIQEYWSCRMCQSRFKQNVVVETKVQELYSNNDNNRWAAEDFETEKTLNVLLEIKKLIKKDTKILDVGCNTGELLDYCKKYGAKTYGVEYSDKSRNICTEKGHVVYNDISKLKEEKFDLVFAFDLVEHLYNVNKFFETCHGLLKNEGRLVILTGDTECLSSRLAKNKWWYISFPEHVIFPSRKFFNDFSLFNLEKSISVFNSKYFAQQYLFLFNKSIYKKIKSFLYQIFKMSYSGLPSVSKDHILLILQKNDKNIK